MVLGSYSLCFLSGCGLWFSLWLKCSGCGLWSCFLYFWSCFLCFVRRCWSLSGYCMWSCFLCSVVLLYVALSGCGLWSCSFSVLSGGVVLWSCFFVWLWSLFWSCFLLIFGYGYAVAKALRLWFFVLFLLSLLGGVVAWLRTRLLFVYFFLFRLLSVSFIFSCGVFLACAFCLCQVVRVELPVFFRSVEVCYNFQVVLLVLCLFLLCLKFSGCGFFV